jgi:hypothetical protein
MNANDIQPGTTLAWRTWTGEEATTTVQIVSPFRISGSDGMYWEATCFTSLDESLARTPGLRIV